MTSPPRVVESARQTGSPVESLANLTLPSAISEFTPPGW